jgi:uncharacterized membrane protein YgcG
MGSFCAISGATELPGQQGVMSSEPMDETYAETDTLSDEPTPQDRAQTSTLAQEEVELFDPGIYAENHPLGAWFLDRILYIVIAIVLCHLLTVLVNILGGLLQTMLELKPDHTLMIGHGYLIRGIEILRVAMVVVAALTLAHAFHWLLGLLAGVFLYFSSFFMTYAQGTGNAGSSSSGSPRPSPRQESFSGGGGTFGGGGASGSW